MYFTYPGILWALSLLSIPIIIHLFYFRKYKQVYFTNVRFLRELVEETAHKNRLKNLLILLLRLLAFAGLILAFAQPYIKSQKLVSNRHRVVSIFIDNSWSMNTVSSEGSLFNKAKRSALDIINAYSDYDKFQILTHELSGRETKIYTKEEAITAIEEVKQSSKVNSFSKIIKRQEQSIQDFENFDKEIYLISDFQKTLTKDPIQRLDSSIQLYLLPLKGVNENNIAIDTAYFTNPVILKSQTSNLVYQLHNYGNSESENLKLSYSINGQEYPVSGISIKPKTIYQDTISLNILQSGIQKLKLQIADYPVQFDDQYYMAFEAKEEVKVLLIYNKKQPENLYRASASIPYFKTNSKEVGALDYSSFSNYRLIVLADIENISTGLANELDKALKSGTNVFVFPSEVGSDHYQSVETQIKFPKLRDFSRLKREVGSIVYESGLFDDVFANKKSNIKLPVTLSSFQISQTTFSEPLMLYKDGSPFVIRYPFGNAYVYVCASPIQEDVNTLSKNIEIFLPLLFKAAISGKSIDQYAYIIGRDAMIQWPINQEIILKDNTLKFSGPEEFITTARLYPHHLQIELFDQLKSPGIYDILNQELKLGAIAFNEDRLESNMSFLEENQVQTYFGNNAQIIDPLQVGNLTASIIDTKDKKSIWWYLILSVILFLLLESLLIRFWRNK